jgi:wyosine [tRNA(Phe)-imidazoG37] synthetase (radical SAM superfamily)
VIAFGPVPSRRLGRSLGINNTAPRVCAYACVYCQLGRTRKLQANRRAFLAPEAIAEAVLDKVERTGQEGEAIDYLSFVPDGEPTLDAALGREIEMLKPLGLPIAVISNAALIWREDVRSDLMCANWVSLKVDSVDEAVWRRIDRPHGSLSLASILEGIVEFAGGYRGRLVTETMLVRGVNDGERQLEALAGFLSRVRPARAYLSIPIRPPAEAWVQAPDEQSLHRAYHILRERLEQVEYLIGYEGNAFAFTGEVVADLLSITAVHPMREDAVEEYLARARAEWGVVDDLVARGQLVAVQYGGHTYYLRKLGTRPGTAHDSEGGGAA